MISDSDSVVFNRTVNLVINGSEVDSSPQCADVSVVSPVSVMVVSVMMMVMMVNISDFNSVRMMMVVVVDNSGMVVMSDNFSDNNSWSVWSDDILWWSWSGWGWLDNNNWSWSWVFLSGSKDNFEFLNTVGGKNSQVVEVDSVLFEVHSVDSNDSSMVLGWGNVSLSVQQIRFTSGSPVSFVVDVVVVVPSDVRLSHQFVVVGETFQSSFEFSLSPCLGSIVTSVNGNLVVIPELSESLMFVESAVVEDSVSFVVDFGDLLGESSPGSPGSSGSLIPDVEVVLSNFIVENNNGFVPDLSGAHVDVVVTIVVVDVSIENGLSPSLSGQVSSPDRQSVLVVSDHPALMSVVISLSQFSPEVESDEPKSLSFQSELMVGDLLVSPLESDCSLINVEFVMPGVDVLVVSLVPDDVIVVTSSDIVDVLLRNSLGLEQDHVVSNGFEMDLSSPFDVVDVRFLHVFEGEELSSIPVVEIGHSWVSGESSSSLGMNLD